LEINLGSGGCAITVENERVVTILSPVSSGGRMLDVRLVRRRNMWEIAEQKVAQPGEVRRIQRRRRNVLPLISAVTTLSLSQVLGSGGATFAAFTLGGAQRKWALAAKATIPAGARVLCSGSRTLCVILELEKNPLRSVLFAIGNDPGKRLWQEACFYEESGQWGWAAFSEKPVSQEYGGLTIELASATAFECLGLSARSSERLVVFELVPTTFYGPDAQTVYNSAVSDPEKVRDNLAKSPNWLPTGDSGGSDPDAGR